MSTLVKRPTEVRLDESMLENFTKHVVIGGQIQGESAASARSLLG
jgi:hypothetical protein